jgi:hypothetical protein
MSAHADAITLADDQLEHLADLIADRLRAPGDVQPAPTLLTAAELAERLGVSREWIYRHADELGAIRLPGGSKERGRLRFDAARVATVCVVVDPSQAQKPNNDGRSGPKPRRRSSRTPTRTPGSGSVGSVLASRPRPVPDGGRRA